MEQDNKVQLFPIERGDLLIKLNRLSNFEKLKLLYNATCNMIDAMEESSLQWNTPQNPREDLIQTHDRKTLQVLMRQKIHQEEQLKTLEEQIRRDIDFSKTE